MTSPAESPSRPAPAQVASATAFAALSGIAVATLMAALDERIVVTAMPRVIAELHGFAHYTGVFTSFMVASTAAIPIFGKLSDLYGRKKLMLAGIGLFVLGSALCGSARGLTALILCRAIQGIGAGSTEALAFTAIADLFSPERRVKITGALGMVYGLAGAAGPPLGGLLTDTLGWRWVFWVSVPVGLASAAAILLTFPAHRARSEEEGPRPSLDGWGMLTLVGWVVPLLTALTCGGRDLPWSSPLVLALFGGAAVLLALFVRVERRAAAPVMPLELLRDPFLVRCAMVVVLFVVGGFGPLLFLPLVLQGVGGMSATRCGTLMLPMIAAMTVASALSGQLVSRLGPRRVAVGCLGLMTAALGLLARMGVDAGEVEVAGKMALLGLTLGAAIPVFISTVQDAVEQERVGTATAMLQFLQTVSSALGAALLGSVMVARFSSALSAALPADVTGRLSPDQLSAISDPQLLMDAEAAARAQQTVGPQLLAAMRGATREALSGSLQQVFLLCMALLAVATVLAVGLRPRARTEAQLSGEPAP